MRARDPATAGTGLPAGAGVDDGLTPRGASRRGVLRTAAVGVLGAGVAAASAGTVRYRDTAGSRARADGATVAELSSASSLRVLWRAQTDQKVIALSFDDGPGERLTAPLLDVLREERVRATFCLVGQQAFERRELVRQQVRDGHKLANHTWSHADVSQLGDDELRPELERTDALLSELTGARPTVIRPPYGRVNGALLQHAARAGQRLALWDLRFHESTFDATGNADYVLEHMRPGSVVVGHDAGSRNRHVGTQAVPAIIRGARDRGYEFVTLSEMFSLDRSG